MALELGLDNLLKHRGNMRKDIKISKKKFIEMFGDCEVEIDECSAGDCKFLGSYGDGFVYVLSDFFMLNVYELKELYGPRLIKNLKFYEAFCFVNDNIGYEWSPRRVNKNKK
jgi:hypothetical protein